MARSIQQSVRNENTIYLKFKTIRVLSTYLRSGRSWNFPLDGYIFDLFALHDSIQCNFVGIYRCFFFVTDLGLYFLKKIMPELAAE